MPRPLVFALLTLSALLRTVQYGGQMSLWLDELAVAQNVVRKPLLTLLTQRFLH